MDSKSDPPRASDENWDRLTLFASRIFVACFDRAAVLVADACAVIRAYNERHELINFKSLVIYLVVVGVVCFLSSTNMAFLFLVVLWLAASEKKVSVRRERSDLREAVQMADENMLAWLAQYLQERGYPQPYPFKRNFEEERVKWVNMLVRQCWPHAEPFFRDKLAGLLEVANQHLQERHLMGVPLQQIMGLRLESLRLGTKAPLIEWVRVVEHPEFGGRPDHFVLEAHITYISDAEIVLYSTKFKAGIRDLHVAAKIRVDFGPTVTKMPLVAGICLYLLEPPFLDFNSTSTASAIDMVSGELFTKLMHSFLTRVITDLLVAPNSISVPFMDASAIRCPTPPGAIRVCVVEAKDLRSLDLIGKIDPYCIVRLGAEHSVTPCVKNASHPRWGHWAQFVCTGEPASGGQDLLFQVLDRDPVRTDAELLSLRLGTREIQEHKFVDKWLQSEGHQRGCLHVQAMWLPFSDDPAQLPVQVAEIAALQSSSLGRKDTKEGFSTVPIDVGHAGSAVVVNPGGFTLFSCLALVWLDSAWGLPESSGQWRVTVKTSESEQHSWTATESAIGKYVWKQSFIFHLKTAHDILTVKLRSNQGSTVKGHLEVALQDLLTLPKLSTGNKSWPIALSTDRSASVRMECTLKILSPAGKAMEELRMTYKKTKETSPPVRLTKELLRIGKSASRGNFSAPKFSESNNDCNSTFYPFPLIGVPTTMGTTSPRPPRRKKAHHSPPSSLRSSSSSSLFYDRQSSEDAKFNFTWRKRKISENSGKFTVNRKSISLENLHPVRSEKESMIVRSLKRFQMPIKARRHIRDVFASGAMQSGSVVSASVVNLNVHPGKEY